MSNTLEERMKRKACPLLVQSDTHPSLTINGESWTRTYFLECIGESCTAYRSEDCFCERFRTSVVERNERRCNF